MNPRIKKVVFAIIVIFLNSLMVKGQNYLNETSKWYVLAGDVWDNFYMQLRYDIIGDTLIDGQSYYKVRELQDLLRLEPHGTDTLSYDQNIISIKYLREESKKFYRWEEAGESLIIDFDLAVGDTIRDYPGFPDTVYSIDSIQLQNGYRYVYRTTHGNSIYEGIGSNEGFLYSPMGTVGEYYSILQCYTQDGVNYEIYTGEHYDVVDVKDCDNYSTTTATKETAQVPLTIYPNPVSDFIKVESPEIGNLSVEIMNLWGTPLIRQKFEAHQEIRLNTSFLTQGLYILVVHQSDRTYSKKFIKL